MQPKEVQEDAKKDPTNEKCIVLEEAVTGGENMTHSEFYFVRILST